MPRLSPPLLPFMCSLTIWSVLAVVPSYVPPLYAYAEWVNIDGKIENGRSVYTVYLDTDSISRTGNTVTVWVLYDYITIQSIVGGPWLSSKTRRQYECEEERVRLLGYMTFTGNMGSGEPVYSNSDQSRWEPLAPASSDRKLWEFVCSINVTAQSTIESQ